MRRFKSAGAVTAITAIEPGSQGIKKGWIFGKLLREGSIRAATGDLYYLDEEREKYLSGKRKKIVLSVLLVLLLALAIVFGVFN